MATKCYGGRGLCKDIGGDVELALAVRLKIQVVCEAVVDDIPRFFSNCNSARLRVGSRFYRMGQGRPVGYGRAGARQVMSSSNLVL